MKKFIAIVCVVIAMATLLTACGKFTCEVCGKESEGKKCKVEVAGEKAVVCEDCKDLVELGKDILGM